MGFLAEDRRINVAVTRARRHVAVICDSRTTGNHCFLKRLVDYMSHYGEVRTAFEYLDDIVPDNYSHKSSQSHSEQGKRLKSAPKADGIVKPRGKAAKQTEHRPAECSVQNTVRVRVEGTEVKESSSQHEARILEFLESREAQLDFPSSLNAHDRFLVHQLAEEYGLQHISTGDGRERYISVRKSLCLGVAKACEEQVSCRSPSPTKETHATCEERGSNASPPKVDLKALHEERMQRQKAAKREQKAKPSGELKVTLHENSEKKHRNKAKGILFL